MYIKYIDLCNVQSSNQSPRAFLSVCFPFFNTWVADKFAPNDASVENVIFSSCFPTQLISISILSSHQMVGKPSDPAYLGCLDESVSNMEGSSVASSYKNFNYVTLTSYPITFLASHLAIYNNI